MPWGPPSETSFTKPICKSAPVLYIHPFCSTSIAELVPRTFRGTEDDKCLPWVSSLGRYSINLPISNESLTLAVLSL